MKSFILKTILFILSLLALYAATWYFVTPENEELRNDFMAAMIDKHERAEKIGSPKIIMAGGSNIAFNINSKRVQDELEVPVVNIGLNVGLGLNFMLEELKDVSKEGDIILLFMTYFEDLEGSYALKKHTIQQYPEARKYHSFDLKEELTIHTRETRNHLHNKLVSVISGNNHQDQSEIKAHQSVYSRSYFNKFGDFEGHHRLESPTDLDQRLKFEYRFWEGIESLNSFTDWATKYKIKAYYVFPAYPKTEFKKNKKAIKKFEEDLSKYLDLQILGEPESFLFSEDYFFDTVYHLNKEGRGKRTDRLLELIENNESLLDTLKLSYHKGSLGRQ